MYKRLWLGSFRIGDTTVLAAYAQRDTTKREHTALIREHYGYRKFSDPPWAFRLSRLLYTRAWISNERPSLMFDFATAWLSQNKVLLPGASTLSRLISEIRERAVNRLWQRLSSLPTSEQKAKLETLLQVPEGLRSSRFDRYQKGPVTISAPAFNASVERYLELQALGIGEIDFSHIPPVRLKNLARHAGVITLPKIVRMTEDKRAAILVAFVKSFETIALDDALDVLDLLITGIAGDAKRIGQKNRLRTGLLPKVDLTELVLEIHAHTGFTDEFTHVSEANARADDLSVSICAVLLAEACNIGLEPLIKHQIPALTRHRLSWVKQNHLRAETLVRGNARLVDYQSTLALAKKWGGGEVASADGMRFVTPVRTINAGPNRKYFPASKGITWYNFLSDQFSGFHGIVVPGTLRDSIFVLEGLLEQQTGLRPTDIMTDTAGASHMVFGLFWLLGYQFSPRLADAGEAVFWRIDKSADYGLLNDLARGIINTHQIEQHWDDMLRIAGSLKLGSIQASELIRSLLKSDRPSSLAQAIIEVGRINQTLYLLNYIDDEDYRRRILTQLNRGEGRHAVARVICHGQRGEIRKRYREGQEDQLGALGLVTNAVVLWNTIYASRVGSFEKITRNLH